MVEFQSKTTFPVTSGLFDSAHFEKIGPALWLYLWLIDKTTSDEEIDGVRYGLVLYGQPISPSLVTASYGLPRRTYQNQIRQLADAGYVHLQRTGHGYIIRVINSWKWKWRKKEKPYTSRPQGLARRHRERYDSRDVDWEAEARKGTLL